MKKEKNGRGTVSKDLTPDHADWLVRNRSESQRVSARLFRLIKENPEKLEEFGSEIQTLIAVSFSLWRSAFLSDKTNFADDTNEGAVKFLMEMLLNNSIAYSQERSAKDWSFNYYAANARYRLDELAELWPKSKINPTRPPPGDRIPKNRWEFLQRSFEKAVDHFEKLLQVRSS